MARDIRPEDALEVAQRALQKVNELEQEVEDIRAERDDAVERLVALELRLEEHDERREYRELSRDEKVGMVREHAYRKATAGTGHARLEYSDVQWAVFDGQPAPSHCYDLLRDAALADGFDFKEPSGGNKHLTVDAAAVEKSRDRLFAEKKGGQEGVDRA